MTIFAVIKGVIVIGISLAFFAATLGYTGLLIKWLTRPLRQWMKDREFEKTFGYPRSLAVVSDYKVIFSDGAVQDQRMTLGETHKWPVLTNQKALADGHAWRVVEIQTKAGEKVWPK